MPYENKRSLHFSFLDILLMVAIAGTLGSVVIPNHVQSVKASRQSKCVGNLKRIFEAKEQWEIQHRFSTDPDDKYLGVRKLFPTNTPVCPSGGIYNVGNWGDIPTCSISGHKLPK
jgi:hypothetical protein